jgi:hypothetical protein
MKIAFIGDSYQAYEQDATFKNSWTYQLALLYPQHQFLNYARGGRGYDYYQWCLLDAKQKGVDVVFVNRTFNHRVAILTDEENFEFFNKEILNGNYTLVDPPSHYWTSAHQPGINSMHNKDRVPLSIKKAVYTTLQTISISSQKHDYNNKWFDTVHELYNFKHIIPLELLRLDKPNINATDKVCQAHGIDPSNIEKGTMYDAGLTVSPDDDHWSLKAHTWVLNNYILTQETIDILSK